jgi:hypothetical protein
MSHEPIKLELWGPPPTCGAKRAEIARTATCELPPGHEGHHVGRSASGYWFSWGELDLSDCPHYRSGGMGCGGAGLNQCV